MLVGSYAEPTEEGIKLYCFNEENGQATYVSGLSGISNPSFLVTSSDEKRIYAVSEEEDETSTAPCDPVREGKDELDEQPFDSRRRAL